VAISTREGRTAWRQPSSIGDGLLSHPHRGPRLAIPLARQSAFPSSPPFASSMDVVFYDGGRRRREPLDALPFAFPSCCCLLLLFFFVVVLDGG